MLHPQHGGALCSYRERGKGEDHQSSAGQGGLCLDEADVHAANEGEGGRLGGGGGQGRRRGRERGRRGKQGWRIPAEVVDRLEELQEAQLLPAGQRASRRLSETSSSEVAVNTRPTCSVSGRCHSDWWILIHVSTRAAAEDAAVTAGGQLESITASFQVSNRWYDGDPVPSPLSLESVQVNITLRRRVCIRRFFLAQAIGDAFRHSSHVLAVTTGCN